MQLSIWILVRLRRLLRRHGIKCLKNLFWRHANRFEGVLIEKNVGLTKQIYCFVPIFLFVTHVDTPLNLVQDFTTTILTRRSATKMQNTAANELHTKVQPNALNLGRLDMATIGAATKNHHHHVVPSAQIYLTLSRHPSLTSITSGRFSRLHPVSAQSCCM